MAATQTAGTAPASSDAPAATGETATATTEVKATAETKPAAKAVKGLKVVGAAVVLRTDDGSERYFYRGAVVDPAAFSKDSIKHASACGLIAK